MRNWYTNLSSDDKLQFKTLSFVVFLILVAKALPA